MTSSDIGVFISWILRTFRIGVNLVPEALPLVRVRKPRKHNKVKVYHAEGVKLCDPTYNHPAAFGSTARTSTSEPDSGSVSESSISITSFFFPLLPLAIGVAFIEAMMPVVRGLQRPRIICKEQSAFKIYVLGGSTLTLVCIMTPPLLELASWNRSFGNVVAFHCFSRQNIVPAPWTPSSVFSVLVSRSRYHQPAFP